MYVPTTVTMRVPVWKTREDNHLVAALAVSQENTARRSQSLHTLLVVLLEQLFSSLSLYSSSGWFVLGSFSPCFSLYPNCSIQHCIRMRFEVFTAIKMWIVFFRIVMLCSLVGGYLHDYIVWQPWVHCQHFIQLTLYPCVWLEAFMVTNINKFFSDHQPCQLVKNHQWFRAHLCPHHQGHNVTMCTDCPAYTEWNEIHA